MEKTKGENGRVIAFDFDGVIARYEGFVSGEHTNEPIEEVREAIRLLKENNYRILIHSTRGDEVVRKYCVEHSIPFDFINRRDDKFGDNPGKPIAFVYVDDRAICYRGQKASELVKEIENFKAHWEK